MFMILSIISYHNQNKEPNSLLQFLCFQFSFYYTYINEDGQGVIISHLQTPATT